MPETSDSEIPHEHLEKTRQEFELHSRKLEVITVTPEQVKKNPKTGEPVNPVFFEHGYGKEGSQLAEWFIRSMAQEGRQAHVVRYHDNKPNDASAVQIDDEAQASQLDREKASDTVAIMKKMGIQRADIVAESAGAPRAMLEVDEDPDMFEKVVLVHPAGMDDRGYVNTHLHVAEHQLLGIMHPKMLMETAKRWWRRRQIKREQRKEQEEMPKQHGWNRSEQKAVARARLHTLIPKLKDSHPHLSFSMIGDKNDYNFRPRRLEKVNGASLFEFVTSKWGNHGIGHQRERVQEVDQLMTRMETGEKRTTQEPRKSKPLFRRILGRPQKS